VAASRTFGTHPIVLFCHDREVVREVFGNTIKPDLYVGVYDNDPELVVRVSYDTPIYVSRFENFFCVVRMDTYPCIMTSRQAGFASFYKVNISNIPSNMENHIWWVNISIGRRWIGSRPFSIGATSCNSLIDNSSVSVTELATRRGMTYYIRGYSPITRKTIYEKYLRYY